MGYADTFYKKENILGYTGDVDKDPTVYFASIDGTTQLVKGRQQLLTQFGHITTAHPTANNVGREPVRECYSYSICNVEYEGKQCAQECVYGQQELDKTGLGSQYKTPDGHDEWHISRNEFIPVTGGTLERLSAAIKKCPDLKARFA